MQTIEICEGVTGVDIYEPLITMSLEWQRVHYRKLHVIRGQARNYDCIQCEEQADEWAWQRGEDPKLITSYEPMCYSCHRLYDYTDEWRNKLGWQSIGRTDTQGSGNGRAKVSEADVLEIRALYAEGWMQKDIAYVYDLSQQQVSSIVTKRTWSHIK